MNLWWLFDDFRDNFLSLAIIAAMTKDWNFILMTDKQANIWLIETARKAKARNLKKETSLDHNLTIATSQTTSPRARKFMYVKKVSDQNHFGLKRTGYVWID